MAEDRVDPVGGWFNLGDRKIEELPSLEESRVTQPRSFESKSLTVRAGTLVSRRVSIDGFQPESDTLAYTKQIVGSQYLRVDNAAAGLQRFVLPMWDIPNAAKLVSLTIRTYKLVDNDHPNLSLEAQINKFDDNGIGAPILDIISSSNNANKTDMTSVILSSPENAIVDLSNFYYGALIMFTRTGGIPNDAKIFWLDYQYIVPG